MKIYKIIVDELSGGCAGKYVDHSFPEPCPFFMVSNPLWCFVTSKSVEENNNPYETRPAWCPLKVEPDKFCHCPKCDPDSIEKFYEDDDDE